MICFMRYSEWFKDNVNISSKLHRLSPQYCPIDYFPRCAAKLSFVAKNLLFCPRIYVMFGGVCNPTLLL